MREDRPFRPGVSRTTKVLQLRSTRPYGGGVQTMHEMQGVARAMHLPTDTLRSGWPAKRSRWGIYRPRWPCRPGTSKRRTGPFPRRPGPSGTRSTPRREEPQPQPRKKKKRRTKPQPGKKRREEHPTRRERKKQEPKKERRKKGSVRGLDSEQGRLGQAYMPWAIWRERRSQI